MNRLISFSLVAGAAASVIWWYANRKKTLSDVAAPTSVEEVPVQKKEDEVGIPSDVVPYDDVTLKEDEELARQLQIEWNDEEDNYANQAAALPVHFDCDEVLEIADEQQPVYEKNDDEDEREDYFDDWAMEDFYLGNERDACLHKVTGKAANSLKKFSGAQKKREAGKKSKDKKKNKSARNGAIDNATLVLLDKLKQTNILMNVNGVICTGKESVVVHAEGCQDSDITIPKDCAVKIFKSSSNQSRNRAKYMEEDFRFKKRYSSKADLSRTVGMWAEKEMHNLRRMNEAGILCPVPIMIKKHILVMSFIGEDAQPAPKLADVVSFLSEEQIQEAYDQVTSSMRILYQQCKLVHSDLSQFNILYHQGKCWMIDVSQGVEPWHAQANEFLLKDCHNIVDFFQRSGASGVSSAEELFNHITE